MTALLTQRQQDVLTLQLAWGQFLGQLYEAPEERWYRSWLNIQPLSVVLAAFEEAATYTHLKDSVHVQKTISIMLRNVTFTT